jgi:hypothetical protein
MTPQVTDPELRREQMAIALRKGKRMKILSKNRYFTHQNQSFAYEPEE